MRKAISGREWAVIWIVGLAGQLCWNVENQLFNTFVYTKIAPDPSIVAWMVAISAVVTTISTFWMGTLSDRIGKRRPFIGIGYILWGLCTIAFGATQFVPKSPLLLAAMAVVFADSVMSFFGSMGNDSGFMTWTTDITGEHNRGQLGAAVAAQPVIATVLGTVGCAALIERFDYFGFFIAFGVTVALVGAISLFVVRDSPTLKPNRDPMGAWHQFAAFFRPKSLLGNRELMLVIAAVALFFISFNIYFPYMLIYFQYTLGFSLTISGALLAGPLLLAVLVAFSLSRFINHGRIPQVFTFTVLSNVAGLLMMQIPGTPALLAGILLVGIGYITATQCMTAWMKNLYPDNQRGQFEGFRIIAAVLLPMVIGPGVGSLIIGRFGVETLIHYDYGDMIGRAPTALLFLFAALVALLTLIPLYFAAKRYFAARKCPAVDETTEQQRIPTGSHVLGKDGTLAVRGWAVDGRGATYDRRRVKTPLRLKEWDFYQVQNHEYVLQMTIGHVSYVGSVSLMLFRLDGSMKKVAERLLVLPLGSLKLPHSAHEGDVSYRSDEFDIAFAHEGGQRRLTARSKSAKHDFEVDITLSGEGDALVIATPFYEANEFYYNHKINGMTARGFARFGSERAEFTGSETNPSFGLLDWGRGVWPFRNDWYWGSACGHWDGHIVAINIGWGFGDTRAATENMILMDGVAHKLHHVYLDRFDPDEAQWRFTSNDGRLDLVFDTMYNRITENKVLWIDNHCDQVFGRYSGTLTLDDGTVLRVADLYGFCEHARNQW